MPPRKPPTITNDLPSPLGQLSINLSDSHLTLTACEIFVAACCTSSENNIPIDNVWKALLVGLTAVVAIVIQRRFSSPPPDLDSNPEDPSNKETVPDSDSRILEGHSDPKKRKTEKDAFFMATFLAFGCVVAVSLLKGARTRSQIQND